MSNRQQKHKHVNKRQAALARLSLQRVIPDASMLVPCAGGCGRTVPKAQGECRGCRRSRVRAGRRKLAKLLRAR